jgi:hypothetical protein
MRSPVDESLATHDPKFQTVTWFGEEFTFSPNQAKCVKVLWNFWKLGTPIIREDVVLQSVNLKARSLKDIFATEPGKRAWGRMIGDGDRRGTVRLVEPTQGVSSSTSA